MNIFDWFRRKSLKRRKSRILVEVLADIKFIEEFKGHLLKMNEDALRTNLMEESKKEKRNEKLITQIASDISEMNSVRAEYQKLQRLAEEMPKYISLL